MRQEIIKTEDGMVWMKFHLSLSERLGRLGRTLPDLLFPRFWDGENTVYGPLGERLDTLISNITEGILGYWIGGHPIQSSVKAKGEDV